MSKVMCTIEGDKVLMWQIKKVMITSKTKTCQLNCYKKFHIKKIVVKKIEKFYKKKSLYS